MPGPDDPNDTPESDPGAPGKGDGTPASLPRLDRAALEAKWQARWAERLESTPAVRLPDDPPPIDLHIEAIRPEDPEDEDSGAEDSGADDRDLDDEGPEEGESETELATDDDGDDDSDDDLSGDDDSPAEEDSPGTAAGSGSAVRNPRRTDREKRRDGGSDGVRPFYCLDMFPYPSTRGFSVNQLRGIAVTDAVARYQRARGRQVFRPLGWDSFGIGIEQEAQELGVPAHEVVERGIETMRAQLERFGALVHWDAEIRTSDPDYYRWTQWLFLKLHEQGLAVRDEIPMKWCDRCRMNLANEEVAEGNCVHCGSPVDERRRSQWKVRTTAYADRLHQGLRALKWPARVKALQRNWIGRREGFRLTLKARSEFQEESEEFEVFTRRLEILGECTYVLLAPEHPIIDAICDELYEDEVAEYREATRRRTDRDRLAAQGRPEGVATGAWALNPVTLQQMPIWVSASVLPSIQLGAILAHPPSDPRLKAFAEHFSIAQNIGSTDLRGRRKRRRGGGRGGRRGRPHDSGAVADVRRRVRGSLDARGLLESRTDFHLRDWIFARQRYWGEPIPIIHCATCGEVPVPEDQLPVRLPLLDEVPETKEGQSPLAALEDWKGTECPRCGGDAERETDTMPQWAASGWYYLRYLSPNDEARIFDSGIGDRWLPVNLCVGGIEHAILHLLYVRFFSYFFHDIGLTEREEPFRRLFNQGRIRAPGTSAEEEAADAPHRGPRIPVGDVLETWGADVVRLHLLFLGPPSEDTEWDENGLRGCARFVQRAYEAVVSRAGKGKFVSRRALVLKHRLIRRVTRALRTFHLNKAVSAFMEFVKELRAPDLTLEEVDRDTLKAFVVLLQPFAPHLAAELWERMGETSALEDETWPEYSDELLRPLEVEIAILVDNRIVDRVVIDPSLGKTELLHQIEKLPKVRERTGGRRAPRVIVVPERLVHLVFTGASEQNPEDSQEGDATPSEGTPDTDPS